MTITLSSASLPTFQHMLTNLLHILAKGEAFAAERKIDPLVLTQDRLAPDMFPFTRQVLIACDTAKNGAARLAGVEPPKFEDNEKTFAELQARVRKTLDFLATLTPAQIDGGEDKAITFPAGPDKTRTMRGLDYLNHWLLPNLYFHITTAYAILRHNGVAVGKLDYLLGEKRD